MSTCAVVRSFIESKTTEVQTSNVGFTSEVSDYLVVHTGPGRTRGELSSLDDLPRTADSRGRLSERSEIARTRTRKTKMRKKRRKV